MIFSSPLLMQRPDLHHAFIGTLSEGPAPPGSLHDPPGSLYELAEDPAALGWAHALSLVGIAGAPLALVHQLHGARVAVVSGAGHAGDADAIITTTPGLAIAIRIADCVPVLIAGAGGVAAVHAGWRGIAAGVIGASVQGMRAAGITGPLVAAIGPAISAAAYEVGEEVVEGLCSATPWSAGVPAAVCVLRGLLPAARPHVDVQAAARWQLGQAGVEQIDVLSLCTHADPRLHSYRRDGAASGRNAALICMKEQAHV